MRRRDSRRASPDAAVEPAALAARPTIERLRPVVLVVDDHDDLRDLLVALLQHHGAIPMIARNVVEALDLLRGVRADVVVTDYAMPGGDGLSLLRQLRAMPERPLAVLTSGHDGSSGLRQAAAELGARFVPKPFALEAMIDAVAVAAKRARKENSPR